MRSSEPESDSSDPSPPDLIPEDEGMVEEDGSNLSGEVDPAAEVADFEDRAEGVDGFNFKTRGPE